MRQSEKKVALGLSPTSDLPAPKVMQILNKSFLPIKGNVSGASVQHACKRLGWRFMTFKLQLAILLQSTPLVSSYGTSFRSMVDLPKETLDSRRSSKAIDYRGLRSKSLNSYHKRTCA